jgi:hypothetical protein
LNSLMLLTDGDTLLAIHQKKHVSQLFP